jgi:hypothetical protein
LEEFNGIIKKAKNVDGAYIELPFDLYFKYSKKRMKVIATFDSVKYQGSIVRMDGTYIIGLTKEIRKNIGKEPGDICL